MILEEPIARKIFGRVEINTIIKKLGGRKLKQTEKNYLYRSIRPKLIAAQMLSEAKILNELNKGKSENTDLIEYNLAAYGYHLISRKKRKKSRKMSVEELIAMIIIKNPSARYIESIPILIIKNRIDEFKMLEIAAKSGIKNKIGYLVETAMMIRKLPYLKHLQSYLINNKDAKITSLTEGDQDFLMRTSPERIKKWNLLGRFFDDDFRRNAEAYL